MVRKHWKREMDLQGATTSFIEAVKIWNSQIFGNIFSRKRSLERRIDGVQRKMKQGVSRGLVEREKELANEYEGVLFQEEVLWFQKARARWIELGDRNTKFFHTSTLIRRNQNRIVGLFTEGGEWTEDPDLLKRLAFDFFVNLYREEALDRQRLRLEKNFPPIKEDQLRGLEATPTAEEIKTVLFSMGPYKAPGPDGLHAVFYQSQWEVVGNSVCKFIKEVFENEERVEKFNHTLITLIPKVVGRCCISQFRPISLCNTVYKLVTKIVANRVKTLLPGIIDPYQSSFIPGRHIVDNIVIAQEVIHSMRRRKGRQGLMAIKIDLEKAYDRLDWGFIRETIELAGFPEKLRRLIMHCITSSSMQVLWNGETLDAFKPTRGIRQGDPLSPYIFVLCIERLNHMIQGEIEGGNWKPVRLSRNGPQLSHIFFADDLLLFVEASLEQMEVVSNCLKRFCTASGQKINVAKTKINFSKNVGKATIDQICRESGFGHCLDLGKYLGAPLLHNRITKATYKELIDRINGKLSGWKSKSLSLAGRITLTKSVISAMPSFLFQTALLPVSICDQIDVKSRAFIWNSNQEQKRIHQVNWNTICLPRECGGLGLRQMRQVNEAFLIKLAWNLIENREKLWVKVLWGKYVKIRNGSIIVEKRANSSHLWRSICKIWNSMCEGMKWRVGDGSKVRFWEEIWLDLEEPLIHLAGSSVDQRLRNQQVSFFVTKEGSWDWAKFGRLLPTSVCSVIAGLPPPGPLGGADRIVWKYDSSGSATVRSAYRMLRKENSASSVLWDKIWSFKGPQRMRTFLWLVAHEKLVTNHFRKERLIAESSRCGLCGADNETWIHALRDCPKASRLWCQLVDPRYWSVFFERTDGKKWLLFNLTKQIGRDKDFDWAMIFGVGSWLLWNWRNKQVFEKEWLMNCYSKKHVLDKVGEMWAVWQSKEALEGRINARKELLIGWSPPSMGWVKANADGSLRRSVDMATAGGLIRDPSGNYVSSFVYKIGNCSILTAELWGAFKVLDLAWEEGYRKIELDLDSLQAVELIDKGCTERDDKFPLVNSIRHLLDRDWMVRVKHVYREANKCADWLANVAFDFDMGYHRIEKPPKELIFLILQDSIGIAWPRMVPG